MRMRTGFGTSLVIAILFAGLTACNKAGETSTAASSPGQDQAPVSTVADSDPASGNLAPVEDTTLDEFRRQIETTGVWLRPSEYGDPYPITRNLIEEGRKHLLLGGSIEVGCPVHILQGAQDPDVPWKHAFALAHRLPAEDVVLTMIQDGDHRLSRPQDIARILAAVAEMG